MAPISNAVAATGLTGHTSTMKKIKTLIVDDEPLARERLATLLSSEADIEVVGAVPRRRGGRHGDPGSRAATWCSSTCRCRR